MSRLAALVGMALATQAQAQDVITYRYDGSYEDAALALESAIIERGLAVDHISKVGDMLDRTAGDVGSSVQIYKHAEVFQFCSAVLSREMMEANPDYIAFCPYTIFIYENDGGVTLGYARLPEGEMQKVQAFLAELAEAAIDF